MSRRDDLIALRDAVNHLQYCRYCAEGPWEDCEGGRDALKAIATLDALIAQEAETDTSARGMP